MIRLGFPHEPKWIDVGMGARLHVRPIDTDVMGEATRKAWRQAFEALRDAGVVEAAADIDNDDADLQDMLHGKQRRLMLQAVARAAVIEWEGIGGETGAPLPCTQKNIAALILNYPTVADAFEQHIRRPIDAIEAEKNAYGAVPNGTSAAAPKAAETASPSESLAQ